MHKKSINRFSIVLNVLLILFLALYFIMPFLNYGFLKTTFKPVCSLINYFQGENYTPAWCSHLQEDVSVKTDKNSGIGKITNEIANVNLQIANPASSECVVSGAKVEMYSNDDGQFGVCVFDDGSVCDEWALYRGECKKGACAKICKYTGTSKEGWYISCTDQVLKLEKCGTKTSASAAVSNLASGQVMISLASPIADSQLSSPIVVEGTAKISSDKIYIRVKNTTGKTLIFETVSLGSADADGYAKFSRKVNYEFSTTKDGFVEVYDLNSSGAEENLVSVPVKF